MPPFSARARLALALASVPLGALAADDAAPAPPPSFGEELVVVGHRPRTAAADPTASASVIETSRYQGEAKGVAELLQTAPGIAVNQYGGLGQLATASIRGSTADQVQVFLDGLPLNTAAGGGVDLSRIPRSWIERIEVVRGAEGARFGAGAMGGVLNIVTHAPSAGAWSVEASGGSFRTGSAAADASVGGQRAAGLAALFVEGTGGSYPYAFDPTPNVPGGAVTLDRTNNASFTAGLLSKGSARLGDGRLDGVLQLSGGRREIPGPNAGNAFAPTPHDWERDARAGAIARWAAPLSEDIRLSVVGTARSDRLDVTAAAVGGTARQRGDALGATAGLVWLTGPHAIAAGISAGGEELTYEGAGTHGRADLALSLADDVDLLDGRIRVGPAVRAQRVGTFEGVSAKLGAAVRVTGPLSLRASAGHAFRAPSFAELFLEQGFAAPNPDLHPESAWSADGSVVAEGRAGFVSAGAFFTRYEDVIVYLQASFDRVKPFNAGQADAGGVEVEAATAPLGPARASGQLAYTFLATETLSGSPQDVGHDLPRRARHRGFARVGIAPEPFEAHAEAHYVGVQYTDVRNLQAIPAALVFNAGASLRVASRPDVRLHVEMRNLLDDRTLFDPFNNPLPGRMVILTVRVAGGKDAP